MKKYVRPFSQHPHKEANQNENHRNSVTVSMLHGDIHTSRSKMIVTLKHIRWSSQTCTQNNRDASSVPWLIAWQDEIHRSSAGIAPWSIAKSGDQFLSNSAWECLPGVRIDLFVVCYRCLNILLNDAYKSAGSCSVVASCKYMGVVEYTCNLRTRPQELT